MSATEEKTKSIFYTLKDELKSPLNVIFLGLAILSIIVSILVSAYFYYASQKAPNPAYLISEERSLIFDSTIESPNIKVLDKNNIRIQDDIYLATVTFWNAGNLAIEPDEIKEAVRLHISPIKQILDYSIIEQTHENATKFKIYPVAESSENSEDAEIELSWDYLGPDFAVKIQIIYIGDKEAEISFSGYIDGTTGFSNGIESDDSEINNKIFILLLLLCTVLSALLLYGITKKEYLDNSVKFLYFILFIISLIAFLYLLLIRLIGLTPPI